MFKALFSQGIDAHRATLQYVSAPSPIRVNSRPFAVQTSSPLPPEVNLHLLFRRAAAAPPYGGQQDGPGRIRPTLVSSPRLPPRPPRLRVALHPKEENRDH